MLGTERYAAPEQYGFSQTDCRSDVYSLGVVLEKYPPFDSKKKKKEWNRLVKRCTMFAPENRIQTIDEVERLIKRMLRKRPEPAVATLLAASCVCCILLGHFVKNKPVDRNNVPAQSVIGELTPTQSVIGEITPVQPVTGETVPAQPVTGETVPAQPVTGENASVSPVPTEEQLLLEKREPEFRYYEDDIPAYVSLKEEIRQHQAVVLHCFKEREKGRSFYVHVRELERRGVELWSLDLMLYKNGKTFSIPPEYISTEDHIIAIDDAYMQSLPDGYYNLTYMYQNTDGSVRGVSTVLYVSERDSFEPQNTLQITSLEFDRKNNEVLRVILKNEVSTELAFVTDEQGNPLDPSLYKVMLDGRMVDLSLELFQEEDWQEKCFFVVDKAGKTDRFWVARVDTER